MTKPFKPYTQEEISGLGGHMGVFELADDDEAVVYIGYAGGRSLFGLRGELDALSHHSSATRFRCEVNTTYLTRYQELLMIFQADHGRLPDENNTKPIPQLGRLSPG